jgi:predicted ATPase/class 3 adenylate cyclase
MSPTLEEQIEQLKQTIAEMEAQRDTLGDGVVDEGSVPFQQKLDELVDLLNSRVEPTPKGATKQRKLVTLLFMDVVGSTSSITSPLDPEDTLEIMDDALKRMALPIEEHGGHVSRYMGDGFKAIFGAPVARENDAEGAVRAGLDILATAQTIASELESQWGIQEFQVRVGINTGLVALGGMTEAEDTVMGTPVNLAARLESAAPPGGLLISHNTFRHIRGVFDVEPLEPIVAKGFPEPVPVYLVQNIKPLAFRVPILGVEGIETHMVGREAELKYLQDALHIAVEDGEGQVITVTGEAGMGKSRLLYEFQNWIDLQPDLIRFFQGRCRQETQSLPYGLLRDLFTFRFQIHESDSLDMMRNNIEAGFTETLGADENGVMRAHIIGQLLGFDFSNSTHLKGVLNDPEQLRNRGLNYLVDYFQAATQEMPVVIILDDIHWGDNNSLNAVNQLAYRITQLPMLIVCAARPSIFKERPHWGEGLESHRTLDLNPLTKRESRQLVTDILKLAEEVPSELRELVVGGTEGNPYYIEELIKKLIEDGIIRTGEETWHVELDRLTEVEVPDTLMGLLQARLDSLPMEERRSLQQASVVGRIFWDGAIQYIANAAENGEKHTSTDNLEIILNALRERELIHRREEPVFSGTAEYIFKHAMQRDVAYESVLKRERKLYHGFVAEWLVVMTQASGRADEYAAVIAEHYLSSEKENLAFDWLFLAGQRAKSQDAMEEAKNYYSRAQELLDLSDLERRWKVLYERDSVLGILGETEARIADDETLIEIAQTMKDDNRLAEAYYRQGYNLHSMGQYHESLSTLDKALDAVSKAGNLNLEKLILGLQVVNLTRLDDFQTAAKTAEKALYNIDDLEDDETLAMTLGNIALYYEFMDIYKAIELLNRALVPTQRYGNHNLEASLLMNIGYFYTIVGLPENAVPEFEKSIKLAEIIGNQRLMAYIRLNLGLALLRLGEETRAQETLISSIADFNELDDAFALAASHSYLGHLLEQCGEIYDAESHYWEAMSAFNQIRVQAYAIDAQAGLARSYLAQGNLDQAVENALEVWEYLNQTGSGSLEFPVRAYLTCAQIFEQGGELEKMEFAIESGHKQMMVLAEKISDHEWQENFITAVPENRDMQELWEKYTNQSKGGYDHG